MITTSSIFGASAVVRDGGAIVIDLAHQYRHLPADFAFQLDGTDLGLQFHEAA